MAQWFVDNILWLLPLGGIGFYLLVKWGEQVRRQRLVAAYEQRGFRRLPEGHLQPLMGPDRFWLLNQPRWHEVTELALGEHQGREVLQFKLSLPDALGRSQHQTATLIRDAGALPVFHLRPETLRDRMGTVMEYGGIDFPALSRYTGVYTSDDDPAQAPEQFLPGPLLDWLSQDSGWCIEARGGHLLVFQAHALVRGPKDIDLHLDRALTIYELLREEETD
jgi:hypothetical protein